ncbi:hypothetical protein FGE12_27315 [Aggregicoccus sp. 17bor-14]|uniref:hypothetical protein n=1 Tax=Myxococcaceae TaxID=31 RepID=UPI00129D0F64|nr:MULTISPECIES: hypothetical protein [Myxococcaceae]MBF5046156.1 hypothetical protein [Simulacricoccus sp. 17bor-14]MRI91882.1 hypothetical protein [Aggregicoccus sp. 17bor-14]
MLSALPLALLLASLPFTEPAPRIHEKQAAAPDVPVAFRYQLIIGLLGVGGGVQIPLENQLALSLEAGIGVQMGLFSFPKGSKQEGRSTVFSPGYSGPAAELGHLSAALRFGGDHRWALDAGLRLSAPVWPQDGLLGATFIGAFLQPSVGVGPLRFATTFAVGPFLGRWSTDQFGFQWLPFTALVLF